MTDTYTQPTLPGLEDAGADLKALRESNNRKYEALKKPNALGTQPIPDPLGVLALRVGLLIELLVPAADRDRYELAFEQRIAPVLDECLARRQQQNLEIPANPEDARLAILTPSGLVVPGTRATGG